MNGILQQIAATGAGEKLCFPQEDRSFDLDQLLSGIGKVHVFLQRQGIRPGDIVSVISGNSSHLVLNLLGILSYGAVFMPINPGLKPAEIENLLHHAGCGLVLAEPNKPSLANTAIKTQDIKAYQKCASQDVLKKPIQNTAGVLIYTSGTTGQPKGVLLSEEQIAYNLASAQQFFRKNTGHTAACLLPLFHMFAVISDLLMTLVNGGKVVVLPEFSLTNLSFIAKAIVKYGVNTFSAVPLIFHLFIRLKADIPPGQLDYCISGGAPLREALRQEFNKRYQTSIIPAYGVTEAVCFCLCSDPDAIQTASVGFPVGIEAHIVDESGNPLPSGAIGEIIISGPSVLSDGYFRDDRPCYFNLEGRKWFRTGDLGKHDRAGRFFITGRLKNMIIKGGAKIYLEDIDDFLQNIPGIADAASLKVEEELGLEIERFVSFIVLEANHPQAPDAARIKSLIRELLGGPKIPDQIIFLEKITRTATGKVKFNELQNYLMEYGL